MEPFHFRRGYSLIELLVVLAIIGVITAVAISNQGSFNKTLILANTAYDVALTIRSAEGFGISSRLAGSNPNAAYGIHFDRATPGTFILFADTAGGGVCGADSTPNCNPGNSVFGDAASPAPDAVVQTYAFGNGITIDKFCALAATNVCTELTPTVANSLDILFARPNLVTKVAVNSIPGYSSACLRITSVQGTSRYIKVGLSGLITANATSCP